MKFVVRFTSKDGVDFGYRLVDDTNSKHQVWNMLFLLIDIDDTPERLSLFGEELLPFDHVEVPFSEWVAYNIVYFLTTGHLLYPLLFPKAYEYSEMDIHTPEAFCDYFGFPHSAIEDELGHSKPERHVRKLHQKKTIAKSKMHQREKVESIVRTVDLSVKHSQQISEYRLFMGMTVHPTDDTHYQHIYEKRIAPLREQYDDAMVDLIIEKVYRNYLLYLVFHNITYAGIPNPYATFTREHHDFIWTIADAFRRTGKPFTFRNVHRYLLNMSDSDLPVYFDMHGLPDNDKRRNIADLLVRYC